MALVERVLPAILVAAFSLVAVAVATGRLNVAARWRVRGRRLEHPWFPRAPVHPSSNGHVPGWRPADRRTNDREPD